MNAGVAVALTGLLVQTGGLLMLLDGVNKYQANLVHIAGLAIVIAGAVLADKLEKKF